MRDYKKYYNEKSFWAKTCNSLKKASRELLYSVLVLYYTAKLPETPAWAKCVIYGALGYFILPIDVVPDFLPGGFIDDLTVLAAAIVIVDAYITQEVKAKAKQKLEEWFPSYSEQTA